MATTTRRAATEDDLLAMPKDGHGDRPPDDFANVAPDLAVEVLSPHDRPRYVLDKIGE